jgi:hypothetical protein
VNISISICPTSLQFDNGDTYHEGRLLAAIREFIEKKHPGATISCLQIGHRQGDAWAKLDGDSEDGEDLLVEFYETHGADEDLFVDDELRTTGISLSAKTLCKLSGLSLEDWGLDEDTNVIVFPGKINATTASGLGIPNIAAGDAALEKRVWAAAVKWFNGGEL